VVDRLETGDWDTSPPSHQTVRRALDAFYHPHRSDEQSAEPSDETLADLTPIQQSIIIAKVMLPEEANTAIADRTGCASSYPGQISTRKEHILTDLRSRVEEGEDIETILEEELSDSALAGLIKDGYLSDIPIDVQSLAGEMDVDEASSTGLLATIVEETNPAPSDSQWGSPVENTKGMQAVPETPFGVADRDRMESDSTNGQSSDSSSGSNDSLNMIGTRSDTDSESVSNDSSSTETTADSDPNTDDTTNLVDETDDSPSAVVSEIISLQEQVKFFKETLEPICDTNEQMILLKSFAEQVEQSCKAMQKAHEEV
jgi:hypothetical protein